MQTREKKIDTLRRKYNFSELGLYFALYKRYTGLEIEKNIAKLFNLKEEHYVVIMNTIRNVEPMVPFKRLLSFNEKMIFKNGI